MSKAIGIALAGLGVLFLFFSFIGLYNSELDTRMMLLIVIGFTGAAILALGIKVLINGENHDQGKSDE